MCRPLIQEAMEIAIQYRDTEIQRSEIPMLGVKFFFEAMDIFNFAQSNIERHQSRQIPMLFLVKLQDPPSDMTDKTES